MEFYQYLWNVQDLITFLKVLSAKAHDETVCFDI